MQRIFRKEEAVLVSAYVSAPGSMTVTSVYHLKWLLLLCRLNDRLTWVKKLLVLRTKINIWLFVLLLCIHCTQWWAYKDIFICSHFYSVHCFFCCAEALWCVCVCVCVAVCIYVWLQIKICARSIEAREQKQILFLFMYHSHYFWEIISRQFEDFQFSKTGWLVSARDPLLSASHHWDYKYTPQASAYIRKGFHLTTSMYTLRSLIHRGRDDKDLALLLYMQITSFPSIIC